MVRSVVTNLNDLVAFSSAIINAAQSTIVWLAPQSIVALFVTHGIFESAKTFMERGGSVRGITYVADPCFEMVRELVRGGADIRHIHHNPREFILIGDGEESISSVYIEPEHLPPERPIVAFWTSDPDYAQWRLSTFEVYWKQSIDSAQRIRDLLYDGLFLL
jgi:hypothetical protein